MILCPLVGVSLTGGLAAAAQSVKVTLFDRTGDCRLVVQASDELSDRVVLQILLSNPKTALVGVDGAVLRVSRVSYRGDGRSARFSFKSKTTTVSFNGTGWDDEEDGAFYDGTLTLKRGGTTVRSAAFRCVPSILQLKFVPSRSGT